MLNRLNRVALGLIVLVILVIFVLVIGFAGRGGNASPAGVAYNYASGPSAPAATRAAARGRADDQLMASQQAQDRLVIKNATLQMVVDNPQDTLAAVSRMADEMGGWVVTSSAYQTKASSGLTVTQASLTIRVPAERLTEALQRIKSGAATVQLENVTGQDVTQEYTDMQSQLTNLEAAEAQLRKIMDSAGKTDDVLAVYRELVQVRGNIEVTRGRMQYYKQAAAYSSIQLTLIASEQEKPLEIAGWRPLETAKGAFQTLINMLQVAVNVLIWLAVLILPLLIVIGLPAWLIARAIRRRSMPPITPAAPSA